MHRICRLCVSRRSGKVAPSHRSVFHLSQSSRSADDDPGGAKSPKGEESGAQAPTPLSTCSPAACWCRETCPQQMGHGPARREEGTINPHTRREPKPAASLSTHLGLHGEDDGGGLSPLSSSHQTAGEGAPCHWSRIEPGVEGKPSLSSASRSPPSSSHCPPRREVCLLSYDRRSGGDS